MTTTLNDEEFSYSFDYGSWFCLNQYSVDVGAQAPLSEYKCEDDFGASKESGWCFHFFNDDASPWVHPDGTEEHGRWRFNPYVIDGGC